MNPLCLILCAERRRHERGAITLRRGRLRTRLVAVMLTVLGWSVGLGWAAEGLPPAWRWSQTVLVPRPGLIRTPVPLATLGVARAGFEDLRLLDPAGREVAFVLDRPVAATPRDQAARSFAVTLESKRTVVLIETGLKEPIESVALSTPALELVKAVEVEWSADRRTWESLGRGLPIFRQAGGVEALRLAVPRGAYPWLRLMVDDRRSPPVPLSGATLGIHPVEPATGSFPLTVTERIESAGQSRLRVSLPAAALLVSDVELDTPATLFSRRVRFLSREVVDGVPRETGLGQDTLYRVALGAEEHATNLVLRLERVVPGREAVVVIENQDSAPLPVNGGRIRWRPALLAFEAREAGTYRLLAGHPLAPAARYDVAALQSTLRQLPVTTLDAGPLVENPGYRPADAVPGVAATAAPLEVVGWKYRAPVRVERSGVQALELGLDQRAHARIDLADLRLMQGTNQVAYLLDPVAGWRTLEPAGRLEPDAQRPRVSRWRLELPRPRIPLTRLTCDSTMPLFERQVVLFELRPDERGERHRVELGRASWRRVMGVAAESLVLELGESPQTAELWLETDNGDNPTLPLERFQVAYSTYRLLYQSPGPGTLWLYYGNPAAASPRYDLGLVAAQLQAAERSPATLGAEEQVGGGGWRDRLAEHGSGGPMLWIALGLVVVGLLAVVRRLLAASN